MSEFADIRVQVGPANYFCYPGALDKFKEFFDSNQIKNAFWIFGQRAGASVEPYLEAFAKASAKRKYLFNGHCTKELVNELARKSGKKTSFIVGIGGGSAIDTAKALAKQMDIPLVTIPTIAATCAAWTPLSVWYDTQARALGFELFPRGNFLILVDPRIIAKAPREYLLAGVADTLAKWYEAAILCEGVPNLPVTAQLGLQASKQINELLLRKAVPALASLDQGKLTQDLVDVIDAVIAGGGIVGGLGEKFTRLCAAHAVHNGLTVLKQTAPYLHGIKVAYGILIQLVLTGEKKELQTLISLYRKLGLPVKLEDLSIDPKAEDQVLAVVRKTLTKGESIYLLKQPVDEDALLKAFYELEKESSRG